MRLLSWHDFDQAVEWIAQRRGDRRFSGIYGIPRGGLVLAVALSHRLELQLLPEPQSGCLVVDDVFETGRTLAPHRQLAGAELVVWISKAEPQWWRAVEVTSSAEWIVFPWENSAGAAADERRYRAERSCASANLRDPGPGPGSGHRHGHSLVAEAEWADDQQRKLPLRTRRALRGFDDQPPALE
jgi:hypoxanthine phosphoribosyltransferase